MNILLAVVDKATYDWYLQATLVLLAVGGFVAATVIGSIGWYNSKRPAGWEDSYVPGWVPRVKQRTKKTEISND
jgi:hypothetical protein